MYTHPAALVLSDDVHRRLANHYDCRHDHAHHRGHDNHHDVHHDDHHDSHYHNNRQYRN
jgi:hypothetical protein